MFVFSIPFVKASTSALTERYSHLEPPLRRLLPEWGKSTFLSGKATWVDIFVGEYQPSCSFV